MATFNWSTLVNGQTVDPFNSAVDIINFDDPLISAADVAITGDSEAVTPYSVLSYGGKTVTINTSPLALTATGSASHVNVTFANGSLLLIGDNTTGTANDEANDASGVTALTGGSGNDQIIGLAGADSLTGGGGNDLFTMYADFGAWGNDIIRGGAGTDAINFNTGDATAGLTVTYSGFDGTIAIPGFGALASITGGGGGNTITMSGVERVTGTHLADTFIGTVATPVNSLRSDVTLQFDGAGGNDTFTGATGDGRNTVISYQSAGSGVTVNLGTGTANDGLGGTDSFTNIDGVVGSDFADLIIGGSASRSISGGTFEFFEGLSGNDTINGGNGTDRVQYNNSPGAVTVNLATGNASDGWGGTDTLLNIEQVRGSGFADTLSGDANDNRLTGDGGNDTLIGGDGFDQASYQFATNAISVNLATGTATDIGGTSSGTDTLIGIESVRGTDFADSLVGGGAGLIEEGAGAWSGAELFEGRAGNDTINGGDTINGAGSIDIASYVTSPSGVIVNLSAGTVLTVASNTANDGYGVNGNTAGIDTLININGVEGSSFNDTLVGGDSDEFFIGRKGNDSIVGGGGIDTVDYDDAPAAITINMGTGTYSDGWGTLDSVSGVENVSGSGFDDSITGDDNANLLEGEFGDDSLVGGVGNDTLIGGDGNDTLVGGLGDDMLDGGAGSSDIANYSGAGGSVTVNLASGTATGTDGNDTLTGIEMVFGSSSNDTITGDDDANFLRGNGGDDVLDGGGQSIAIANGNIQGDFADYRGSAGPVTVSLALQGSAQNTGAGSDTLTNFESIRGSDNAGSGDTLTGDGGNNFLRGGLGNDTLNGGAGTDWADYRNATGSVTVILGNNDTTPGSSSGADGADVLNSIEGISGSDFNDTLTGGSGDDWFRGRNGNDSISGGGGYDTVTYRGVGNSVNVNLFSGIATGEGTDTMVSIEAIEGSMFFADTLTGDNLPGVGNDIFGLGGSDLLRVTQGDDLLDGGADSDSIDFTQTGVVYSGTTAVSVNLATGVADLNRSAAGDNSTLISIETVIGTAGDDIFVGGDSAHQVDSFGNSISERFRGNGGNDSITGGTANGLLTYSDYANNLNSQHVSANLYTGIATDGLGGTDTLVNVDGLRGGAGNDLLVGGSLSRAASGSFQEIFRGNAGNDTLDSGNSNPNGGGGDRADYGSNTNAQGINVNLATGTVLDGLGGTDTLIDIYQVYGGAGNDTFLGSADNDTFDGGIGNDTLDGAGGSDEARFLQSTAAVIVNLSASSIEVNGRTVLAGTAYDGMGGTDTLISMENVRGSDFNDHIRGSDSLSTRQFLNGDAGNDTIDGGAGIDFANYSANAIVLGGLNAFIENGSGTVNDKMGGTDTLINIEGLAGTHSADTLTGGLGDQWFRGNGGSDSIDGGAGNDWVLYSNDPSGVTINLGTGTATDGFNGPGGLLALGGTDTLVSIENAEASDFNDIITGSNSTANELRGRSGSDTLRVTQGLDTLDGGADSDNIDFTQTGVVYSGTTAVSVNLATGVADLNRSAAGDNSTLISIETVIGTAGDDIFVGGDSAHQVDSFGNSISERFRGDAGNDSITGGTANGLITIADYANNNSGQAVSANLFTGLASDGRGGTDTLVNVDRLHGGAGNDLLVGGSLSRAASGSFQEIFRGNAGNDTLDSGNSNPNGGGGDRADYGSNTNAQGINVNLATGTVLDGLGGTDTLIDIYQVFGGAGNDTFLGSADNDTFDGGIGNDTLDGAGGSDEARFLQSTAAVIVNLSASSIEVNGRTVLAGTAYDGMGGTDTLISMENVRGSDFNDYIRGSDSLSTRQFLSGDAGNDTIDGGAGIDFANYSANAIVLGGLNAFIENGSGTVNDKMGGTDTLINIEGLAGTHSADTLTGGLGDQWFRGNGGSDSIDGGAGNDWVLYSNDPSGVTINLGTGTATDGFNGPGGLLALGGTDTLVSIENAEASDFNDIITGSNSTANELRGRSGSDTLRVTQGLDTLDGGADSDNIDFTQTGVVYSGTTAVSVNLATGVADLNRSAAGDNSTLISIETVIGTAGDDIFVGGDSAHQVDSFGNSISERFRGDAGNDSITGGTANGLITIADYANNNSGQAVSANLFTGLASDGRGGTDTLVNVDRLHGGAGNDLLVGGSLSRAASGSFQEIFRGNAGNDTLDSGNSNPNGGGGDRADYGSNTNAQGINVNLATGTVLDGLGGTDTLIDIYQVFGGAGNDTFLGSADNDTFDGGIGNDTLDGAGGSDEARFLQSTAAVIVNLSASSIEVNGRTVLAGTAYDGMGGTDTLISMENVRGSDFNDYIRGSDSLSTRQFLSGDAGNDTIDGGAGIDFANYSANAIVLGGLNAFIENGSGTVNDKMGGTDTLINIEGLAGTHSADTLTGGLGDQWFRGNGGSDSIDGGAGNDWVLYSNDPSGVTINLGTGTATDGFNGPGGLLALGGTDTLVSIENAEASDFNDIITGSNSTANELRGRSGSDTLRVTQGLDTLDGGADSDNIDFTQTGVVYSGTTAVSVNLATGVADLNRSAAGDNSTLISIETVIGTAGDDIFVGGDSAHQVDSFGNSISERFRGDAGNDSITGGTANGLITIADYANNNSGQAVSANLFTGLASDGRGGTDTLVNVDRLHGGAGNDLLVGGSLSRAASGSFQEIFRGNAGNDTLDSGNSNPNGGGGDRADYGSNTNAQGINVNLATGTVLDGLGGTDTLIDIYQVFGGAGNDTFLGSADNDTFDGGIGNDTLDGAGGSDEARFLQSTAAVIVNLSASSIEVNGRTVLAGTAYDGMGGTDTLISMENVRGSDFNDYIRGSDSLSTRQFLSGDAGNDTIDGGAGIDFANYSANAIVLGGLNAFIENGSGTVNDKMGGTDTLINIEGLAGTHSADTLTGGLGDQWFRGNGGSDSIDGGAGNDWVLYSNDPSGVTINLGTGTATDGFNGPGGLLALGGTDTLVSIENAEASDFNDIITGSNSTANELRGRSGSDTLRVTQGLDTLDGGADSDNIDFTQTGVVYSGTTAVSVNLATGVADLNRSAAGDNSTLISIETVIGTAGDDIFVGGDSAHQVDSFGNSISERFRGDAGNDSITGGTANGLITIADYANNNSGQAVSANLFTGLASDGRGGTDTLVNVDRLHGGAGNDLLVGGSLSRAASGSFQEIFRGNAGNDTLDSGNSNPNGGGGDRADYGSNTNAQGINVNLATGTVLDGLGGTDTLIDIYQVFGGAGNDTFLGSADNDTFDGGIGNDTLDGAGGSDEARFLQSTAAVIVNLSASSIEVNGRTVLAGTAYDGMGGTDTLISMENVRGSDFNDYIRGSDSLSTRQFLSGDAGNDTIDGGAGIDFANYSANAIVLGGLNAFIENGSGTVNDKMGGTDTLINIEGLAGTHSADTLTGGLGDQWFRGNGGSDSIDGGAGNDWVLYSNDPSGVTINLGTGTATDGFNGPGGLLALGGTDTLVSIENAEASDFNDIITGSSAANELRGRDGNDVIAGGAGNDTLDGGAGIDTASYAAAGAGVSVTLFNNTVANDGQGGSDTLVSIETVLGSNFNDTLVGSVAANRFEGAGGNDLIFADAGNDTLYGGDGDDQLNGGVGNDTLDGGAGVDTANYFSVGAGVSVTLWNNTVVNDGQGGSDTLVSIETVLGSNFNDTLVGSVAANRFEGADGNDLLFADAGNDTLFGGNGDDRLNGGAGNDTLDGGAGVDVADYFSVGAGVSVTLWNNTVVNDGQGGSDTLVSIETVLGSNFNDTLVGSVAANRFEGADGNDLLFADAGNDTLFGGNGDDRLNGGAGNDTLDGGAGVDVADYFSVGAGVSVTLWNNTVVNDGQGGSDTLVSIETVLGSNFNDTLVGSVAANRFEGADGNDLIFADAGNDTLFGGNGDDRLNGGAGNDTLDGGAGVDVADYFSVGAGVSVTLWNNTVVNDGQGGSDTLVSIETVLGSNFNDTLVGSVAANRFEGADGNDLIFADAGNDTLFGGNGDDRLNGGAGNDTLDGGAGVDVADYFSVGAGVSVTLWNNTVVNDGQGGSDTLVSIETVLGSNSSNDTLVGSVADNRLEGAGGNDLLFGDAGADTLIGGAGNDILAGGNANDVLTGGTGADNFRFDFALGSSNIDTITDFTVVDDTIQLENAVFTSLVTTGALAAGSFVSGSGVGLVALQSDDYILYDISTGALYYDSDADGAGLAQQFATLTGLPGILASDFLVV